MPVLYKNLTFFVCLDLDPTTKPFTIADLPTCSLPYMRKLLIDAHVSRLMPRTDDDELASQEFKRRLQSICSLLPGL